MANVLNISSSLEPVVDTTGSAIGGQTYTESQIDKNTGALGGLYKSLEYAAAKAIKWQGVLADNNTSGGVAIAASAFEGTPKTGTAPTTAKVLAVSYDSTLGTCEKVWVYVGSQCHARLKVGEACVIPISGDDDAGIAIANCKLRADAYVDGTHEATVTAIMIGV